MSWVYENVIRDLMEKSGETEFCAKRIDTLDRFFWNMGHEKVVKFVDEFDKLYAKGQASIPAVCRILGLPIP